jgi:hypothetical protein
MPTLAYLRVSKHRQDVNRQRLAVLEFARCERLEVHDVIELSISSTRSVKPRQVDIRLDRAQDLQTRVTVTMFSLFAEIERELTAMRTTKRRWRSREPPGSGWGNREAAVGGPSWTGEGTKSKSGRPCMYPRRPSPKPRRSIAPSCTTSSAHESWGSTVRTLSRGPVSMPGIV